GGRMRRFEGRVAFVTGAAHGIGRAIVQRLAAEGASVVLADIETTTAEQVRSGLAKQGALGLFVACDITDRAAVNDADARTLPTFDRLDVLVNNAGGSVRIGEFEQTTMADWHRQLDVTLIGAVHAVQAALPHLLRVRGNVVSVASVNGLAAFGEPAYSAAKAGLVNLTRTLAVRYGAQGLRFNVVAPGTVRTRNWDDQPGALERLASIVPLGRVGEPAD